MLKYNSLFVFAGPRGFDASSKYFVRASHSKILRTRCPAHSWFLPKNIIFSLCSKRYFWQKHTSFVSSPRDPKKQYTYKQLLVGICFCGSTRI